MWFLFATVAAQAQVVITSGGIQGASNGEASKDTVGISGANFSLTCGFGPYPSTSLTSVSVTRNASSHALVTFSPAQQANLTEYPCLGGTATFNGLQYVPVDVEVNMVGSPMEVTTLEYFGNYLATVSNIPFSMTGTISMCPLSSAPSGPLSNCDGQEQVLAISGTGVYSGSVTGNLLAGGPGGIPSAQVTYQFTAPSGFVLDTTNQGNWNGNYGMDGYLVADGASYQPPYAAVSFLPNYTYSWVGTTDDVRAPQSSACPILAGVVCNAPRTASAFTWYGGNSFNLDIIFTDNLVHRVALYLLDWDYTGRQETVTIQQNGMPFDTETFTNFQNGQYGAWNLMGNVVITVSPVGPANPGPVVSGLFFGPGASNTIPSIPPNTNVTSSATYVNSDGQTQGTWTGRYGTDGYMIANGNSQFPSYGVASMTGAIPYTWASGTSDPRAPQTSPGSANRIASSYTQYASHSFTANVNITDGTAHPVSLYLLDWDTTGRQETITIQDSGTQAVLYAGSFSGFHNGEYLTWLIQGNVTFTVTPIGPASPTNPDSPVVTGIFFN
jgi:hypothetical protein